MTDVPFVDLDRSQAEIRDELDRAIGAVVDRGDFILGAAVGEFEAAYAKFCGVDYAVGVNSGTAALALAIAAAGIGPGDEVVVPAHTYIASAFGISHAGATPVLCDVDDQTGLIDLGSAEGVVSDRTAAILPVHLYGQVCDMDAVGEFASRHSLAVIEDAAQAQGATWKGARAGSFGTAAAFSFYPSKNLGAFGDAGAITTNDPAIADRARRLRNLGQLTKGEHEVIGQNERLDTLQAAVLRVKLDHLDSWNASRAEAAVLYDQTLPESVARIRERPQAASVFHLMAVRLPERESVRKALSAAGIGVGTHYDRAIHEHEAFADLERRTDLTHSERWAASELSLPMFPLLSAAEVELVCGELERVLSESQTEVSAG